MPHASVSRVRFFSAQSFVLAERLPKSPSEIDARVRIYVRSSRCETAGLGAGAWALVARC